MTLISPFLSAIVLLLAFTSVVTAFSAFSSFQFAPSGVCVSPRYFFDGRTRFTMRNVPGEGNCMFLAVALASLCSVGLGGNDALLNSISRETREVVANVLSSTSGNLVIEGKTLVSTSSLLKSAAQQEGVSTEEYISMLRNGLSDGARQARAWENPFRVTGAGLEAPIACS